MRLLLIDDNKEITEAIGFYCKSAKHIRILYCQVINEGKEGLESIRNEEFYYVKYLATPWNLQDLTPLFSLFHPTPFDLT